MGESQASGSRIRDLSRLTSEQSAYTRCSELSVDKADGLDGPGKPGKPQKRPTTRPSR
jgi:hypothetical protein